jgi:hypothetical protein
MLRVTALLPPCTLPKLLLLRLDKERLLFCLANPGSSFRKFAFCHRNNSKFIPSMKLTLKALVTLCTTSFN